MARVDDVVLIDHPANASGPRSINSYLVEVQDFTAAALGGEGKKFKLDPQRILFSLQWLHNATPPDLHLSVAQDEQWVSAVSLLLLGALRRCAPQAIDWAGLTDAGIVNQLDAFEAAMDSKTARRH
jgi:hypothetical protein